MTTATGDAPRPRLRILHVVESYGGGILEAVRGMTAVAAQDGHEVLIAFGRRPETPADPRAGLPAGADARELPWGRRSPGTQLRAFRALRRLVREWQPDVVHLHSSFAGVVGGLAAARTGIPVVYTPHSFASSQPNTPRLSRAAFRIGERLTVRLATLVGAVSESEAAIARESIGAQRVCVVPNGIPEIAEDGSVPLPPSGRASDRPTVLAGGRMVPQRRPHESARILAALTDSCSVAWIGGGRDEERWARGARAALERAGVPLTGWLPREDALARLGEATAYLHWTSWDGHPLSVLEAMARDVVVVASDIAPNREILGGDQVCATEEEAVSLLRSVVADDELAERLRAEQRLRRGRYSAVRMGREWLAVYEQLIGSRPA